MRRLMIMAFGMVACSPHEATRAEACDTVVAAVCGRWAECYPSANPGCEANVRALASSAWGLCPAGHGGEVMDVDMDACAASVPTCAFFDGVHPQAPAACGAPVTTVTRAELCAVAISSICGTYTTCFPGYEEQNGAACEPWLHAILCPAGTEDELVPTMTQADLPACTAAGQALTCEYFNSGQTIPDACGDALLYPVP